MYDLIIIGAGPAGLTAGIYALRAGLKTLILEKETIGGQISSSPLVQNYPGFSSISGAELSNNLYEQVESLGGEVEIEEVLKINDGDIKTIVTDETTHQSKAVIIATGAKYRLIGLDKETDLIGKGIHFCTSCDGAFYKDKTVAVIGGANTAVTNAIYMANISSKVYLIYRGDKLKCEKALLKQLETMTNVEVIYNSNVTKILGDEELEAIEINHKDILNIDGMFESIGMSAQNDISKGILSLNDQNYIISSDCETNKKGIFVAGDCRDKKIRQLTTAVSDGAIAATAAIKYIGSLEEK